MPKLINKRKVDIEWKDFVYQSFGRDDSIRIANNSCFYSIIVEREKIIGFGEILDEKEHPEKSIVEKDNKLFVWPIDEKGVERRWRWTRNNVASRKEFLRFNKKTNKIECQKTSETYKTVWMEKSRYDAGRHGTAILKKLVPNNKFSFPKSLWNVYDCLYAVVGNDKNAIILDFFGGSGTTAHAVLELNKQDEGNRKFIICEQMNYIETVTRERIRKVCEIDNKGSFVYCELAEFNQAFINQIQNAKNTDELWRIWEIMKQNAFLSYRIEPKNIDSSKKEFEELSFTDKQNFWFLF